jgi:alkylation response protein AidB-like acyl-CoA dehydrogenase
MGQYAAPLRDMRFVLYELLEVDKHFTELPNVELDRPTLDQMLESAGRFATDVLFPLNQKGDREGCQLRDGEVTTPTGFRDAFRQYREAGWPGLDCRTEDGGQGLPHALDIVFGDIIGSANHSFSMYPGLTHGAYSCILAYGTEEQKRLYLPKLASCEWTGTMCLTEAHAGTDLGLLRTRAEPQPDGSYLVTGEKIFISSGDHDLADNVVHLVLARLPGAPAGTKGISLLIVPKYLPDAGGGVGPRNGVQCSGLEHKMGIRGNATCVMSFDAATGWLLGAENKGLAAMFLMMNAARLTTGMQGLQQAEVAYQNALAYAKERVQGRSLTGPKFPDAAADPIIVHPDVRRMLLTQKAYIEGARAFGYWLAVLLDREHRHADPAVRQEAAELVALLTPVMKAFVSDNGYLCTNLAQQVFGGHGYISESGMDQYVRDARIAQIYEGTNGIQALDLLGRKVLGDRGVKLGRFAGIVQGFIEQAQAQPGMGEFLDPLGSCLNELLALSAELGKRAMKNADEAGAAATDYLRVMGHCALAYWWARMASVALQQAGSGDRFYVAKLNTARFYFTRLLPEAAYHARAARAGPATLMALEPEAF